MALPVNIEDLLSKRKVEENRIEFKRGWNPDDIYHSISAFANDIDNLGGGYILVGIDQDSNGLAKRPVFGVPLEQQDKIQKDMVAYNNMISPYYLPRTSFEQIDGKEVFVIWVPAGVNRPYAVPANVTAKVKKPTYYVRSGSSSIVAKGEVHDELMSLASHIPFDEQPNPKIKVENLSMVLLRDYLVKVGSRLQESVFQQPMRNTLEQMDFYDGPTENRMLKNVAAMMFCEHPEKIFPYTQAEIVIFPNGRENDPNNFSENILHGSVPQLINGALTYLKNTIIMEYVVKQPDRAESLRYYNYPMPALEETITNAFYHRDYSQYEPVTITVEPNGITVTSIPGPDRSISQAAIQQGMSLRSRRYRNRRLGDFLKELDLTEGRSTGIPTIQTALKENGSPRAIITTDDNRTFIDVFIPIHEGCGHHVLLNSVEKIEDTTITSPSDISQTPPKHPLSTPQASPKWSPSTHQVETLIKKMGVDYLSMAEMMAACELKDKKNFRETYVNPALSEGAIERQYPNEPTNSKQKYKLTEKALEWKEITGNK